MLLGSTLSSKDLENIPIGPVSPYGMVEAGDGMLPPQESRQHSWVESSCLERHPDMPGQLGLSSRPYRVPLVACPGISTCQLAGR